MPVLMVATYNEDGSVNYECCLGYDAGKRQYSSQFD